MTDIQALGIQIEDARRRHRESVCDVKAERLELRRRTFGNGGKHFVWQCLRCGEQRGGPLSAADAKAQLVGREAAEFDVGLEGRHRAEQARLQTVLSELLRHEFEVLNPEGASWVAAATEEREALSARIQAAVDCCVEKIAAETSDVAAAEALSRKAVAIRREVWTRQLGESDRFPNEEALKLWLTTHLSADFELYPEVPGAHVAAGVRVQIDFLAYPKQHLIDEGFLDEYFGIEVKHLSTDDGFSQKAAKAFWQAVSYTDSKFFVNGKTVRLKYAVLFSSMSFQKERLLLRSFGHTVENDVAAWQALRQLANHANVGTLEITGDAAAWKGWLISFAGGRYFSRRSGDDGPVFRLSNARMVLKNRIGSF